MIFRTNSKKVPPNSPNPCRINLCVRFVGKLPNSSALLFGVEECGNFSELFDDAYMLRT